MSFLEFLAFCQQNGIRFDLLGEQLKVHAADGVLTPDVVERLRHFKPQLLAWLANAAAAPAAAGHGPIPTLARDADLPVSYGQETLWLADQVDSAGAAYHFFVVLELDGALDRAALQASFSAIVERHQALRTVFVQDDAGLRQVVLPAQAIAMPLSDLAALGAAAQAHALQRMEHEAATAPFDLARDPMLRLHLVRCGAQRHALLLTLHHIASDGWSLGVLVRELQTLYAGYCSGEPAALPALPVQYADYAHWLRATLEQGELGQALPYWQRKLADAPEVHGLPTDFPRPARQSYRGARLKRRLDPQLAAATRRLAQQSGATVFMVLESLFAALVARYARSGDVVLGTPVANRLHDDLKGLIGYFVNVLVLRHQVDPGASLRQLVAAAKADIVEAFEHQQVPLEKIIQAVARGRSVNHAPLVQLGFFFQNNDIPALELPGLACRLRLPELGTSLFDLKLEVSEAEGGFDLCWEYVADLFAPATIERMAGHYEQLLRQALAQPECPLQELDMAPAAERALLAAWNDTAAPLAGTPYLHGLFEQQVARTPDAVALYHGTQAVTYRELNRRANRVAHYLLGLGVQRDQRVALCIARSVDMVAGLLGIFKAGAAYVPLDADYPVDRVAYMLEDSEPVALLTQAQLRERLPALDIPVLELDMPAGQDCLAAQDDANPDAAALGLQPQHLAYVIYTSGSTGKPKGVMVEHLSAVNYVLEAVRLFGLVPDDVVLQQNSLNFDLSLEEMLPAFTAGASLKLATQLFGMDDAAAVRPSFVHTTAAHWAALMGEWEAAPDAAARHLAGVRLVNVTGDALAPQKLQVWDALCAPHTRLVNTYGPTEAAVSCTASFPRFDPAVRNITIGTPFRNVRIYILDPQQRPLPVGVPGEMYIAGVQVGRGYLNRPDLSAGRFLDDPFRPGSAERMYRTGDLARWLDNGEIEFLGRVDHQVKVRGFRIELGEVEMALAAHAHVRDALVLARAGEGGEKRLVAYIVGQSVDMAALRQHIARSLPEYMVPAALVLLDAFPLTPNGKLDRAALPEPDAAQWRSAHVEPRNALERTLCRLWGEILGVERVGVTDNFFQLGGHSLAILRMVARAQERGLSIPVRQVFATPSIEALAGQLAQQGDAPAFRAPPNAIPADCGRITPDLLPLAELSQQEVDSVVARVPGGVANVQDIYALAPLQEGVLFHHLMSPESDPYVIVTLLAVQGRAAVDDIVAAMQFMVDRHDVFRTAVLWEGLARPVQVVYRRATLPVRWLELDPGLDAVAQMRERCAPELQQMDLTLAPLVQLEVARDPASGRHFVLMRSYHIVSDHAGMEIIHREVTAYRSGQAASLPPPVPYREFVAHALHQEKHADADAFFRAMLGDIEEPSLPFGRADIHRDGAQVVEVAARVPAEVAQGIRRIARELAVGPAAVIHAAWALVVAACSGRQDVVFGTVMLGRLQGTLGADSMLGMFMNTLPIRASLQGRTAGALVKAMHAALRELLPYEQASLAKAQRCSAVPPGVPLFSALLNYRHSSVAEYEQGADMVLDADSEMLIDEQERTNYPLVLSVDDLAEGFALEVLAEASLGPDRVLGYVQAALAALVQAALAGDQAEVLALPVLPAAERQLQLHDFNATAAPYARQACIHTLFEEQARRVPDAVALVAGSRQLSYRELDRQANRLAHWLRREKGVGPDRLVGVCMARSADLLVGMLAILKAGGAYVPLDPAYPAQRLAYMLADAQLDVVLTHGELPDGVPVGPAQAVRLDDARLQQVLATLPAEAPPADGLAPRHLAYVIYTSGSTGHPKGVMVEHGNVVNFLASMAAQPGLAETDRLLAVTSTSFDIHGLELFLPLSVGACVVLASTEAAHDPERLAALLHEERITVMQATPATWKMLLESGWRNASPLRVLCGGEALGAALAQSLLELPGVQLWNMYGPTETTIWSCTQRIEAGQRITMGRPIANTQVYVAAASGALAPLGVAGELLIGGAGVARGYRNRPELTDERFIANPFHDPSGASSSARVYRTGDLVRWLEDGSLEFLGRIDQQVKVRGFRIELGEIETVLTAHAEVRDAVVTARQASGGDARLVAYVVGPADVEALRRHLAASLPEYMVPAAFVTLEALPLTPNGKVDRKALPEPELAAQAEYVAPRTATEETLCAIWQEVLGVERVGATDNFFQLGGHSILATRLLAQINQRCAVALPVKTLFQSPTLAGLAFALDQLAGTAAPSIVAVQRTERIPLSFAQQRLWLIDRIDGGSAHYNMPAALKLSGDLDPAALQFALSAVVERHESLRTVFGAGEEGQPFQLVRPAAPLAVPLLDISGLAGAEQQLRVEEEAADEAATPFDLARDQMLRARLLRLAGREHILLVTMHHIASDGWSLAVLVKELCCLYAAFRQGEHHTLAPLPVQYADYALWQRQWLQGEVLDKQLDYWQAQLAGIPVAHSLPLDFPRPPMQGFAGRRVASRIAKPVADALQALCQAHGATLFMGLHAAFSVLLARYSNESDIVIGSPIANREQAEVAGLIGFFVNTLVLRSDVGGNPGFGELLEQSRNTLLEAYAHQQVPFEQVVERLQPQRSLAHSPLFQVMLVLQNNEEGKLELPGLSLEPVEQGAAIAKYDLSLNVSPGAGGLQLDWEYNIDLFQQASIERMARHFGRLLESLLQAPGRGVHEASMMEEEEQRRLLLDLNASSKPCPTGKLVHQLFEGHAQTQPDAVALVQDDECITYGELNRRANRLARHLAVLGVGPDQRVAICLPRSVEMVVGLLAILKAGGAYVCLDSSFPAERLRFMLEDASCGLVLTRLSVLDGLPQGAWRSVCIDRDAGSIAGHADSNPVGEAGPDNLAYCMYTSGSTGQPKGVAIPHRSVLGFMLDVDYVRFDSGTVSLQYSSTLWDVLTLELWPALSHGGRCVLYSGEHLSPRDIGRHVREHGVNTLWTTAAFFNLVVDEDPSLLAPLAQLMVGGDAVSVAHVRKLMAQQPQLRVVNGYGPSECTVFTSCYVVPHAALRPGASLPIGRPVGDRRVYVLDAQRKLAPLGAVGELYVSGDGVAREYLNRPELTAEKFLADPFVPGGRMYRTGDLVRWLDDGNLEFLGRIDQQVKIRGFRIELGEIEAALKAHAAVRDAVVLARQNAAGDKRLVAYVVGTADAEALRSHLAGSLPDYMVPSAFVALDALPLTPNGKVDRKALPEADLSAAQGEYVAPRTPTEETLCAIWQELLGLERVGATDNFFHLGGHSLLATRLASAVEARFQVSVPLQRLFSAQTVEALAILLDTHGAAAGLQFEKETALLPTEREIEL